MIEQIISAFILFVIFLFILTSIKIRCNLGFHKTFINTQFSDYSEFGYQTLRCELCKEDIKDLGWINMNTGEKQ